jgi:hypothetical protein
MDDEHYDRQYDPILQFAGCSYICIVCHEQSCRQFYLRQTAWAGYFPSVGFECRVNSASSTWSFQEVHDGPEEIWETSSRTLKSKREFGHARLAVTTLCDNASFFQNVPPGCTSRLLLCIPVGHVLFVPQEETRDIDSLWSPGRPRRRGFRILGVVCNYVEYEWGWTSLGRDGLVS